MIYYYTFILLDNHDNTCMYSKFTLQCTYYFNYKLMLKKIKARRLNY